MLHARRKSQSPPCSAKAGGGGGGGIGRYRSASFIDEEFKAPHRQCIVLELSGLYARHERMFNNHVCDIKCHIRDEYQLWQVDDLGLDEPLAHTPWWRRLSVWMYIIPALLSAIIVAAAILMRIFNNVVSIWPIARPFEEPAE